MTSAPKEAMSFPQNGAETMLDISSTFSPPMAVGEVFSDEFISIWPDVQISPLSVRRSGSQRKDRRHTLAVCDRAQLEAAAVGEPGHARVLGGQHDSRLPGGGYLAALVLGPDLKVH